MATKTFTWLPDLGAQCSEQPSVVVTKFGDGYESRLATTINSQPEKWSVTFTKGLDEFRDIKAFLKEHGAVTSFDWVTPDGDRGRYVCRSWSRKQYGFGVFQINGDFEQVFEEG